MLSCENINFDTIFDYDTLLKTEEEMRPRKKPRLNTVKKEIEQFPITRDNMIDHDLIKHRKVIRLLAKKTHEEIIKQDKHVTPELFNLYISKPCKQKYKHFPEYFEI